MSKITDGLNEVVGREAERAAIVAWLRKCAVGYAERYSREDDGEMADAYANKNAVLLSAASSVERGDHLA